MIVNTLIVGGGPAGLAPLISASRAGLLDRIMTDGVAIAERGRSLGAGRIGRYAINSDSTANTLVSCIRDNPHPALAELCRHPVIEAVAAYGTASVPLTLVGEFMNAVGKALRDVLARSLFKKYQTNFGMLNRVLDAYEPAANRIANTVGVSFVQERERIIRQQQEAILRMPPKEFRRRHPQAARPPGRLRLDRAVLQSRHGTGGAGL